MRAPRPLSPTAALLPLRIFLGATFVYAGVQKLSDPGFLSPGASSYIGTQLRGFAQGTPGGLVLRTFARSPTRRSPASASRSSRSASAC